MKRYLEYFLNSRLVIPIVLAGLVGVVTGLLAVGFIGSIEAIERLSLSLGGNLFRFLGDYWLILVPVIGGLIVGPMVIFLAPEAKGHGVPEVLKAIAVHGGRIRPVVVLVKAAASALSIGTGFSVGREGPIVQVGSALGSSLGQYFKFSEIRLKNMIACGAAAGIAAVFNAPIAGVMFASEVILRDFGARALSTVVVAAVASSIISRIFLGEDPAFVTPSYALESPVEMFFYVLLGLLSALAAIGFIVFLAKTENIFDKWRFPAWLKPAFGGILIGVLGLMFPQILGSGLKTIEEALHGNMELTLLMMLIVVKILATSLSLGAGSSGGVFAPSLFIGAVLGGAFGNVLNGIFPETALAPGAYAVVGMASVFAASAHAPVTAVLIVFEMTGDYKIILPMMVSVVLATVISQMFHKESIYTDRLKEKGVDLEFLHDAKILGSVQVSDVMEKKFEAIPTGLSGKKLMEKILNRKGKCLFTFESSGKLCGIIKPEKIQETLLEESVAAVVAADIAEPIQEYCLSNEPLSEASRLMMAQGLMEFPVMDPENQTKMVGVLRSENIFKAITSMSAKQEDLLNRMGEQKGPRFYKLTLSGKSPLVGKMIRELKLPRGVVFSSLKRGKLSIVPHGETVLKSRDRVSVVVSRENEKRFQDWLKQNKL